MKVGPEQQAAGPCPEGTTNLKLENNQTSPAFFFKTLIFFDLESTGVYNKQRRSPSSFLEEPCCCGPEKVPRITEIAMNAYGMDEYMLAIGERREPRSAEKHSWQINPQLPAQEWTGGQIAGLRPASLETKGNLQDRWPEVMVFLKTVLKPACLLAHNGDAFDFRLLKDEICRFGDSLEAVPEGVFVADTIQIIRELEAQYRHEIWTELEDLRISEEIDALEEDARSDFSDLKSEGLNRFRLKPGIGERTPNKKHNGAEEEIAEDQPGSSTFVHAAPPIRGGEIDRAPVRLPAEWGYKLVPKVRQIVDINAQRALSLRTGSVRPDYRIVWW